MTKINIDVQNQCDQCGETWPPPRRKGVRVSVPKACPQCHSPEVFQYEVRWFDPPPSPPARA